VTVTFVMAGEVSDYAEEQIEGFRTSIATAAGVNRSSVAVSLAPASVRLVAVITPEEAALETIVDAVSVTMGTADVAAAVLGVPIVEPPAVTWTVHNAVLHAAPPTAPPRAPVQGLAADAQSDGITMGMILGGATLAACLVVTALHRRQLRKGGAKTAGEPRRSGLTPRMPPRLSRGPSSNAIAAEELGVPPPRREGDERVHAESSRRVSVSFDPPKASAVAGIQKAVRASTEPSLVPIEIDHTPPQTPHESPPAAGPLALARARRASGGGSAGSSSAEASQPPHLSLSQPHLGLGQPALMRRRSSVGKTWPIDVEAAAVPRMLSARSISAFGV